MRGQEVNTIGEALQTIETTPSHHYLLLGVIIHKTVTQFGLFCERLHKSVFYNGIFG